MNFPLCGLRKQTFLVSDERFVFGLTVLEKITWHSRDYGSVSLLKPSEIVLRLLNCKEKVLLEFYNFFLAKL